MRFRNKKAFTLIELLVVIAIIALLLAILMPSLKKVKQQAQGLVCRTKLKDIGLMAHFYMSDHDGCMVTNEYADKDGKYLGRWTTVLGKYYNRHKYSEVGTHDRYNTDMFFCPLEWKKAVKAGGMSYGVANKGFHYWINGFITGSSKYGKATQWRNPSQLPMVWDISSDVSLPKMAANAWFQMYPNRNLAKYGWNLGDPKNTREYRFGPAPNHGAGMNYLFSDLHVDMTMWPYKGTLANPKPKEYYYKFWHPRGDLSLGL